MIAAHREDTAQKWGKLQRAAVLQDVRPWELVDIWKYATF